MKNDFKKKLDTLSWMTSFSKKKKRDNYNPRFKKGCSPIKKLCPVCYGRGYRTPLKKVNEGQLCVCCNYIFAV